MASCSPGLVHSKIKAWVCDSSAYSEKVLKHSSIEDNQEIPGDTAG